MNPRKLTWFHGLVTLGWAILIIPTVLWWKQSVPWIALMSVWANFASHFSAWQASRTEVRQKEQES